MHTVAFQILEESRDLSTAIFVTKLMNSQKDRMRSRDTGVIVRGECQT